MNFPERRKSMPQVAEMLEGARVLVDTLTDVKPGEHVVILTDDGTPPRIAEVTAQAVRERNGVPVIVRMDTLPSPNLEPPPTVAAAIQQANVIMGFLSKSIFHTKARLAATQRGARMISPTGIAEETLVRGLVKADFFGIKPVVDDLGERITAGRRIHITSPRGTDLTAIIEGRRGNCEIWSREPGQVSGAPGIEVNVPPLESSTEGKLVVDASVAGIGLIHEPIHLTVERGRVTKFEGGVQAEQLAQLIASANDPHAYVIAEIGIGLNPEGQITGNIIEDESAFGTAHVALGNNTAHGGENPAPIHVDMVFSEPTIAVDGHVIVAPGIPTLPSSRTFSDG
jgi:leucyl aminopeptidase (aminopeptidase T)